MLMASGMTIAAAGRGAGYSSYATAREASKRPAVQKALQYFREQMREEVKFERQNAHLMYRRWSYKPGVFPKFPQQRLRQSRSMRRVS